MGNCNGHDVKNDDVNSNPQDQPTRIKENNISRSLSPDSSPRNKVTIVSERDNDTIGSTETPHLTVEHRSQREQSPTHPPAPPSQYRQEYNQQESTAPITFITYPATIDQNGFEYRTTTIHPRPTPTPPVTPTPVKIQRVANRYGIQVIDALSTSSGSMNVPRDVYDW